MYGVSPTFGLSSSVVPQSILTTLTTEEQLVEYVEEFSRLNSVSSSRPTEASSLPAQPESTTLCRTCDSTGSSPSSTKAARFDNDVSPRRALLREDAGTSLAQQAARMRKYNRSRQGTYCPYDVGTVVLVPVPKVDRARGDNRSVAAVIVEITEHRRYRLVTAAGVLASVYDEGGFVVEEHKTAASYDLTKNFANWRSLKTVSVGAASSFVSVFCGQGRRKCNCQGACDTSRCSCRKLRVVCTTHCHVGNRRCCNTHEPTGEVPVVR